MAEMSQNSTVKLSIDNQVATISLNNPDRLNAFSRQLRLELAEVIERVNQDDAIRVVLLTGEGRAFSSGADLQDSGSSVFDAVSDELMMEYKPIIMGIDQAEKIYIAAINGPCAGIGVAVAMACDLAIMSQEAYLYQAFAAIGLVPDGGSSLQLLRRLGYKKALEVIMQARKLSADECLQSGLVNRVAANDELMTQAQNWAQELAAGAPIAQRLTKKILKAAQHQGLSEVFDLEAQYQDQCSDSSDARNAIIAFLTKQKPIFTGE